MDKKINTNTNLFKVLKNYKDKWVALSPDYKRVVSSGLTLEETESKLKAGERNTAIFYKVMPSSYIPDAL